MELKRYALNALRANWKTWLVYFCNRINLDIWDRLKQYAVNSELDYLEDDIENLWSADIKWLQPITDTKTYVIDQWRQVYTQMACVPTSIYLGLCENTHTIPDWNFYIKLLNHLEDTRKWSPKTWANHANVAIAIEKYWNIHMKDKPVKLKKGTASSKDVIDAAKLWYRGSMCYKNNAEYSKDKSDNNIIDFIKWFYKGTKRWGHCVWAKLLWYIKWNEIYIVKKNWLERFHTNSGIVRGNSNDAAIIDQYPVTNARWNIYINNKISQLVRYWLFGSTIFYFVPQFDIDPKPAVKEIKKTWNLLDLNSKDFLQSIGWWNWENWTDEIIRQDTANMVWRSMKLILAILISKKVISKTDVEKLRK